MPGDVRYTPYVNMAPQDPTVRPFGGRPRFAPAMPPHQHQFQHQQQQQLHHQSPAYYQATHIPVGGVHMVPSPIYAMDGRSHSSRGREYSSPISAGYSYFTPPASNGLMSHSVAGQMIPPPGLTMQPRFVNGPQPMPVAPPRLPDRRIMPYGHPQRGFFVDQFASVDVFRREPLPQDWHPFVDYSEPPSQPAVTGGVMAILDYDVKVMAEFVANVGCNFINLPKPWAALTSFVEKVLNQTRLPSSTVILAITYLAKRLTYDTPISDDPNAPLIETSKLYEYLTMSLILANKFLDDNTFTNTSWSDISGIARKDINVMERDWLWKTDYRLHVNPVEQKGWSTWRKAWETWQFDATGKGSPSLLSPVLSRTNSSVSSPQSNGPRSPSRFAPSNLVRMSKNQFQNDAYLTPPVSPTFDSSSDSDFFSPVTPPPYNQWQPLMNPSYHPAQLSWRPLSNARNVPLSVYPQVPIIQKPIPPRLSSNFWEPEKGSGSPWCECAGCHGNPTFNHTPHRPNWIGMTS